MRSRLTELIIVLTCGITSCFGGGADAGSVLQCGQPEAVFPLPPLVGAIAYSNGPADQGTGSSCAGGEEYQCVNYVKRYYASILQYQKAANWHGYARDYCNAECSVTSKEGLQAFPQGSGTAPIPDDLLVFGGGSYGHVAIITNVTETQVTIIEQNWSPTGTATLPIQFVNAGYQVGPRPHAAHYFVKGWLRLQSPASPTGTVIVNATLDIVNPVASAAFTLTGPNKQPVSGPALGVPIPNLAPGPYTLTFTGSAPVNTTLTAILPCGALTRGPTCTATLGAGQTLPFTMQFTTNPPSAGFTMSAGGLTVPNGAIPLNVVAPQGGTASVSFDGSSSTAVNGNTIKNWSWTSNGSVIGTTRTFSAAFPSGTYNISLVVTDSLGHNSTAATGTVKVTELGSLTDLGTLGGASGTVAYGINNNGQVVGTSWTGQYGGGGAVCNTGQCPIWYAFLWSNGAMTNLGLPAGANAVSSVGYGVNNLGEVVGAYSYPGYYSASFLYSNGVNGTMNGVSFGAAYGINSAGLVVGASSTGGAFDPEHAFLYSGGNSTDLGTIGGSNSSAAGINEGGQVAGYSFLSDNATYHAVRWASGVHTDLGTLGGTYSRAFGINNSGVIVGAASTVSDGASHAFSFSYSPMQDLGALGGTNSQADAINNIGQIVGWANTASGDQHAFVWSGGQMVDLNAIASLGPAAALVEATGINDYGQAVANGNNGRAYLLTVPPQLPGTIVLSSTGTVDLGQSVPFPISLSAPAPAGGVTLTLASDDTSKVTVTPSSITILGGSTTPSALPQVAGIGFGTATISVSAQNYVSVFQQVHVREIVYSQTSFDPTINYCDPPNPVCAFVWYPTSSISFAGQLYSITLKLAREAGHPNGFNFFLWVTDEHNSNPCGSRSLQPSDLPTPGTWKDVEFTFADCRTDFSAPNHFVGLIQCNNSQCVNGLSVAGDVAGNPYMFIRSQ